MECPKFIRRRRSYFVNNGETYKLFGGGKQQLITLYQGSHVVGTYQTSERIVDPKRPYWNYSDGLYFTSTCKKGGDYIFDEFKVNFNREGGDFCCAMTCNEGSIVYDSDSRELKAFYQGSKEYREFWERDKVHFSLEIIAGDYFHDTDIQGVLTMLNHHILPNDLVRMTKGFLY